MPIIRDIVYGAVARGASLERLCDSLGITPFELNDSDRQLMFKDAIRAWEIAVELTSDPLLGLHIGERTHPSILGLAGHLMQSSSTLLEAFRHVCQYSETATDMFQYQVKEKNNEVILKFTPASAWVAVSPQSARQAAEQAMAGTLNVFYLLCGKSIYPTQATFSHKRGADVKEYERVFQSSLLFKTPANQLIFSRAQLQTPVLSYDRSLHVVFEKMLKDKKQKKSSDMKSQLRQLILSEFKGQVPAIDIVASRFSMTARSLQRKLAEEETSFRQLSAELQNELASQLLSLPHSKVAEVARLLGYSEASAFRKAYKSWTQKTPSMARRK